MEPIVACARGSQRLINQPTGQGLAEYALILALIADHRDRRPDLPRVAQISSIISDVGNSL
jgi:hypothetical protein